MTEIMSRVQSMRRFVLSSTVVKTPFSMVVQPRQSTCFGRLSTASRKWSVDRGGFRKEWKTSFATSGNGSGPQSSGEFDYDLFAVGAGSGGVRAARQSAARGKRDF